MQLFNLLLDVAPYPRERIIGYDTVRGQILPGMVKPESTDTIRNAADTASASQDLLVGASGNGDDMTMLFVAVGVVFMALALCVYFVYSYRRSYQLRLK